MYIEKEVEIRSARGTMIPCSVILQEKKGPLVMFIHGFKADRTEGGRFTTVAKALAEQGVSSICFSFAGCGDSKEDFIEYCPTSCLDDMERAYSYMIEHCEIDREHLGMVGYSMGGRLTSLFSLRHPEFKTLGFWAAANFSGNMDHFHPGMTDAEALEMAKRDGFVPYFNDFDGQTLHMSYQFYKDMMVLNPVYALRHFEGAALVCQGDADDTVLPEIAYQTMEHLGQASKKELHIVHGANHGFGLWDDHMEQSKELTDTTIRFFSENL